MDPIVIIDYGAGNLRSVQKAFEHLGHEALFTSDPAGLDAAPAIVFPGQGASPPAMDALERDGMADAVKRAVARGVPFFGVCLGLQLLLDWSEEGDRQCLGIVPGVVRRFNDDLPSDDASLRGDASGSQSALKVPHMGWNAVTLRKPHPVFEGVPPESYFYFVHSYYAAPTDESWVAGTTSYGIEFASVVAHGSMVATQFHPEKSGAIGLRLYDNFVKRFVENRT